MEVKWLHGQEVKVEWDKTRSKMYLVDLLTVQSCGKKFGWEGTLKLCLGKASLRWVAALLQKDVPIYVRTHFYVY